ncbi:MAG TPA: hypothetical protein VKA68_11410 [bacterium]|nr:hypothetical protein [bacterium]
MVDRSVYSRPEFLKILGCGVRVLSAGILSAGQEAVTKRLNVVRFRMNLKLGSTRLQTWFTSEAGESRGAYYVSVKQIS